MKVTAAVALAATLAQTASAHYIWQTVNGGPAYQYFRTNTNYNSPVTDLTLTALRCNVGALTGGSTGTLSVSAGTKLTLGLDTAVYHQGPVMFYLGKVPSGTDDSSWDGSGASWFKFYELAPDFSKGGGGSVVWPMSVKYDVTIPSGLPAGNWLLRAEQIGLHNPGSPPQFYVGCAQLAVTGGGSCSPSYVSIPGHITSSDPSLLVNIYSPAFTSYKMPGPAVQACNGGSSGGSPSNPTTTSRAGAATTTTSRAGQATTTSARATTTAAASSGCTNGQYTQCGGSGFTGCKGCAGSYTCKAINDYYSQCL